MTLDQINVATNKQVNASRKNASYCYSDDGLSCHNDYLSQCNLANGYNCSTYDEVNLAPVSYCISGNN